MRSDDLKPAHGRSVNATSGLLSDGRQSAVQQSGERQSGARLSGVRAAARTGLALVVLATVAGCGGLGRDSTAGTILAGDLSGGKLDEEKPKVDPTLFLKQKPCPPIEVRGNSHVMSVYARGRDGEPHGLRYQATLRKWARECINANGQVTFKIGLAGRVVSGPAGIEGPVTLPVRIAVTGDQGEEPLVSQLFTVDPGVVANDQTRGFATVIDSITLPEGAASKIYIGFDDEGRRR